jgi:hypothetical protein
LSKPENEVSNLIVAIFLKRDPLEIVEDRTPQSELYNCILKIVTEFASMNKTSATNFIKEKVHNRLFSTIQSRLSSLINNGSCVPDDLNNTSNLDIEFFRLFSSEIKLLTSLFNCKSETDED